MPARYEVKPTRDFDPAREGSFTITEDERKRAIPRPALGSTYEGSGRARAHRSSALVLNGRRSVIW